MKLKLNTIILFVRDVEKLKTFYCGMLGFELVEEIKSEWLLLDAGHCRIGLHRVGDQYLDKIKDGYKFDNNTKIVFDIDEDISQARDRLIGQGVTMSEIKTFANYDSWLCDGEDPEGNVFQLKQRK